MRITNNPRRKEQGFWLAVLAILFVVAVIVVVVVNVMGAIDKLRQNLPPVYTPTNPPTTDTGHTFWVAPDGHETNYSNILVTMSIYDLGGDLPTNYLDLRVWTNQIWIGAPMDLMSNLQWIQSNVVAGQPTNSHFWGIMTQTNW